MSRCYLYRHFAEDGSLLYVGISLNAFYRLDQHKDASHWFDQIATIKIESFDDRKKALAAEREAIAKEKPLHNLRRPSAVEILKGKELTKSHKDLLQRIVQFKPIYSMDEAASALVMSKDVLKQLMDIGNIGYIDRGKRKFITGWQLIEFIEAETASQVTVVNKDKVAKALERTRALSHSCRTESPGAAVNR